MQTQLSRDPRDPTKADKLTLHASKEEDFWLWVASWALFLQRPSDLGPGSSDEGYNLPEMKVFYHEVKANHEVSVADRDGQMRMFRKMGYGMPEYLLLFRKPQTDTTKSYADVPVRKDKKRYSKARWQVDAHGFARSNGDRPLHPEDLRTVSHHKIFGMFHDYYLSHVYDFEHHVRLGDELERQGRLPVTFMLLQPPSWHPDVWTDITRMLTANALQAQKGKQLHLCPMQFDLADRVIAQMSNPGDVVFDPFAGLGTVPSRAIALGRYGVGVELNPAYFIDAAAYCKAAEGKVSMPTLFSLQEDDSAVHQPRILARDVYEEEVMEGTHA